ncbi:MAG TPA: universal stress protein [Candidatus Bathyarchaeia archaeon]|nr:universal stress protein [Candidatus Bathyarchaeia archaeon]
MEKIRTILAPVDLSSLSEEGVRCALQIARWQGAEVIVYNVITVEETPFPQGDEEWVAGQAEHPRVKKTIDERKGLLARFVDEKFAHALQEIKIRQEVEIGTPYKKIVEKAAHEGVDIIVMSTHGRTGLMHMLIGSVTEKVVRRAPCPVLSVPPPEKSKPTSEGK